MAYLTPTNRGAQNGSIVDIPRDDWQDKAFLEHMFQWESRWPNFQPAELACRCCGALRVHYDSLDKLQLLRKWWGAPMSVSSGFRCAKHNERVGGAKDSYHMKGMAFDIRNASWSGRHVAGFIYWATKADFKGFGLYPTFIHIDTGPHRTWEQGHGADAFDRDDVNELGSAV